MDSSAAGGTTCWAQSDFADEVGEVRERRGPDGGDSAPAGHAQVLDDVPLDDGTWAGGGAREVVWWRTFETRAEALEAAGLWGEAMSQENMKLRAAFEAWNAGDMDALRDLLHPDVIMRMPEGWPEPGPYMGRDAVMREWRQLRETWVCRFV